MAQKDRTLTEADIHAIAEVMAVHNSCHMGLTPDEVTTLKRFLGAFNKAAGIIGTLVLTAIVAAVIAIFTKGFWTTLITGVKTGAK